MHQVNVTHPSMIGWPGQAAGGPRFDEHFEVARINAPRKGRHFNPGKGKKDAGHDA